jgi:hypothetical protein
MIFKRRRPLKTGNKNAADQNKKQSFSQQKDRWIARLLYLVLLLPFFLWGFFALWWGSWPPSVCLAIAVIYACSHFAVILIAPLRRILPLCFAAFLIPLASFFLMQPSDDRNWQPDVAKMPYAEIEGDRIVVHNVRNCDYKTEMDFIPRFESRTYDLTKLRSVDVMLTDWGLKYIAHTMVSFGFEGDNYLCFSIETRKEIGESYSAIKGFFRQYELIYIAGDEQDLVRLRTNFRKGENVYLYRLRATSLTKVRNFFMGYIQRINHLHENPEWYNALTQNCMTSAFRLARAQGGPGRGKWHWSIILNGFADRHAYEVGTIDKSLPFEEFKRKSLINDRALSADDSSDFSKLIRQGIPGMGYMPEKGD